MKELPMDISDNEMNQNFTLIETRKLKLLKLFAYEILLLTDDQERIKSHILQKLAFKYKLFKPTIPNNDRWSLSELFDDIEDEDLN